MFYLLRTFLVKITKLKANTKLLRVPHIYSHKVNINFRSVSTNKIVLKKNEKNYGLDNFKARLLLSLNFKCVEDSLPFRDLPVVTLIHISKITKDDRANGYCDNRLYYISTKVECAPAILSGLLVKRLFIYELSFDWLENSLNAVLDMGVPGDRIIRDLWVLKYHHQTIKERLQSVKDKGIDNLHPWMVRCTPDILNRYICLSKEIKNILGDDKSTLMYLAERLNTSVQNVENLCVKVPALKTIRVTKVKKFLDFLIQEGFSQTEIMEKPRVFAASQKTVKNRIDKLRSLGISQPNLNILCRSRKHFQKYVDAVESVVKDQKNGQQEIYK